MQTKTDWFDFWWRSPNVHLISLLLSSFHQKASFSISELLWKYTEYKKKEKKYKKINENENENEQSRK